jgi:hypothetical protein
MRWPVLALAGVLLLCVFFTIMMAALALGPRTPALHCNRAAAHLK